MDESVYPKRKNIRWRWDGEDNDYITYMEPMTGSINILNPTAATIFEFCDGKLSLGQIIDKICEIWEIDNRQQIKNDVLSFIDFMTKSRIIIILDDKEKNGE